MRTKVCYVCGNPYPVTEFAPQKTKDGYGNQCRLCRNAHQREKRKKEGNSITRRYEKTFKGFLMREYRNMQSRVMGVQKNKAHLYLGKELIPRSIFYEWALCNTEFMYLFTQWEFGGYDRKLTPTVDRIDSSRGYTLDNMEWVTHSENSRRGSVSRNKQYGYT